MPRQRNKEQIKEQSKTSKRELSNEEIANLSDGKFKALVIKMLTELIELGQKMKKQMKDTQSEISKMFREPTVAGRKPGLRATIWNKRNKKKSIQKKRKKQEFKKVKRDVGVSVTT